MRIGFEPGALKIIRLLFSDYDSPRVFYAIWRYSRYNATITATGFLQESIDFDSLLIKKMVQHDSPCGLAIFHNDRTFFHSDDYFDFLENHTGKYGIPTIEAIQKSSSCFSGRVWTGEQYVGEHCNINVWATFEVDLNLEESAQNSR